MKRKRQLLAAASLAALAAMSAQPALGAEGIKKGWQQEGDGQWVYLHSDGSKETETWKKGDDGFYYYLDEDGYMATDSIIKDDDDIYYVDQYGVRVSNRWVSRPNDDECDQDVDVLWYYFGKNGMYQNFLVDKDLS